MTEDFWDGLTEAEAGESFRHLFLGDLCEYVGIAVWELRDVQDGRPGDPWTFMARARDCARAAEEAGHVFTG